MNSKSHGKIESRNIVKLIKKDIRDVTKIYFMPVTALSGVFRHAVKTAQKSLNADLRSDRNYIHK